MKLRGLLTAILALGILSGMLYWSEHHKASDDTTKAAADAPPSILKFDQASVTALDLKRKNSEPVMLAKTASGDWQITQSKPLSADQSAVTNMLGTLSSLNSERVVEDKASDLKRY